MIKKNHTVILRRQQVEARTGLARSTIYDLVKQGTFPAPIPLGAKAVGWVESEVEQYLAARIAERDRLLNTGNSRQQGKTMNALVTIPTIPGMPFQGGFYAGRIRVGTDEYAVIVSPKTTGDHDDIAWGERGQDIAGARSFFDGHANTLAMAEAGSALARWARELNIDGFSDWYLPSRDELEICYRNLKPTQEHNWPRCGDNPSTIPPSYPYSETEPAQTTADAFQEDGAEAFTDVWYWSSTQFSAHGAWGQNFDDGSQNYLIEGYALRARAVRRFKISN